MTTTTSLSERAALAIARNRATGDGNWDCWDEVLPSIQLWYLRRARIEVRHALRNRQNVVPLKNQNTPTKDEEHEQN